ncbi:MAG: hypothetical protein PHP85_00215 [Gallionella sp.]|nr:hypothetical protein [Gallionella sp.]
MKFIPILFVTMFIAVFSTTAFALDEHDTNAVTEKTEAVKTEKGEVKKTLKRHNHMEEKTGMPMSESKPDMHKEIPKNRHDHMKEKN